MFAMLLISVIKLLCLRKVRVLKWNWSFTNRKYTDIKTIFNSTMLLLSQMLARV